MNTEDEKWTKDGQSKEMNHSTSCSSLEALEPHDPVISGLATRLFEKSNEYLQGEMAAGQEHYSVVEEVSQLSITKYQDLRHLSLNLAKTLNEYNGAYVQQIKPLLEQIDELDELASRLQACAFKLESYTKQLKARFKELEDK